MTRLAWLFERLTETPSSGTSWSLGARINVLLPGLYAWGTTVAFPVASARAPTSARLLALAALIALVLGPLVVSRRPVLGRIIGIHGFFALALLTWVLVRQAGGPLGTDPLQASCGALGWMLFAFGWGRRRPRPAAAEPEDDARGPLLEPRGELGRSVNWVFGCGVLGALTLVLLAFRVTRSAHGVMAQAIALVAGLWLIGSAARVALDRAPRALPSSRDRIGASRTSLGLLGILLGIGLLVLILGR